MFENIKVFTSDKCWQHIFTNLGADITDSPNIADVVFDDINIKLPISVDDLQRVVLNSLNNTDIINGVFGKYVVLPKLQHKIIVMLVKNPNITMSELKNLVGVLPGVTTHSVENAVYQLRKKYGHDFIINIDGKYTIGHV